MAATRWSGLLAAAVLCGSGAAWAEGGGYAIPEHRLVPAESPQLDPDLRDGNITRTGGDDEDDFITSHTLEGLGWTTPSLGQELFPHISAGTLLTATHDRDHGTNGFAQRVDLDLYWLQVRIPSLITQSSRITTGDQLDFDLLLPWKIDGVQRRTDQLLLVAGRDHDADPGDHARPVRWATERPSRP